MENNKYCTLVSFFGSTNLGDIILSNILYDSINVILQCKKVNIGKNPFLCLDRIYTERNSFNQNKLSKIDALFRKHVFFRNTKLYETLKLGWKMVKNPQSVNLYQKKILKDQIVNSCALIVGGGNLFFSLKEEEHPFYTYIDWYTRIAMENSIPILFLSIGIGPFYKNEHLKKATSILNRGELITFRDQRSLDIYNLECPNSNISFLSVDPAFLISGKQFVQIDDHNNERNIAVNFVNPICMNLDGDECERIKSTCINLVRTLSDRFNVILFSTDTADYSFLYWIKDKCKDNENINIFCVSDIESVFYLYSNVNTQFEDFDKKFCFKYECNIIYTKRVVAFEKGFILV